MGKPLRGVRVPWRLVRSIGALSTVRISGGGLLFVSQVLLAGWMGQEAFGLYSFAWAWVAILGTLSALGLPATSVRFIAQYRVEDARMRLRGMLRFARLVTLLSGCVTVVTAWATASLVAPASPYLEPLRLALFAVPIIALLHLEAAFARGFGWMGSANVAEQIARPLLLILAAWVLATTGTAAGPEPYVLACVGAYLFATLGQHFMVRARARRVAGPGSRAYEPRPWLRVSLPLLVHGGASMVLSNLDLLLVGFLLGPSEVAVYTAAVRTATLVSFVYIVVGMVAQPTISALHAQRRFDALAEFASMTTRWILCAAFASGALLWVFGGFVLRLFGPDFDTGESALWILIAGHVAVAALGPVTSLLSMTGHQDAVAAVFVAAIVVSASANLILVPLFGIAGAALATALTLVAAHGALLVLVRRHLGFSPLVLGLGSRSADPV